MAALRDVRPAAGMVAFLGFLAVATAVWAEPPVQTPAEAVRDPQAALAWAAGGHGVAVLAINAGDPWWTGLRREWSELSVFDGFGGETPTALAVGRIDPAALPGGRHVLVTAGGDAGDGSGIRRRGLDTHHGWTLSLTDAALPVGGDEGCVGSIG